ncbi:MAG: hypothetical protein NTW41_12570 [Verrucomicrobia bacterium]|nr:hypothetical protein [Verrucomicrobiota bacterium]
MPAAPKIQLLHGTAKWMPVAAPNFEAATDLCRDFITKNRINHTILVSPFANDPVVDFHIRVLTRALAPYHPVTLEFAEVSGNISRLVKNNPKSHICFICPEDNTAKVLFEEIQASDELKATVFLFATQGTGVLSAPAPRLRFDFRRLGRSAAAEVLLGQTSKPPSPSFVSNLKS